MSELISEDIGFSALGNSFDGEKTTVPKRKSKIGSITATPKKKIEIVNEEKKYWIIPSNPEEFDALEELKKGTVWWSNKLNYMQIHDIVYIYITQPIQKISIKTKIIVSNFLKDLNESIVKVCSDNGEIHPDRFMIGHSIWLEVDSKEDFSRAFLKVITEFKDVKDMHFDEFKKIIKEIKIFGIIISIENAGGYEVLINILQNDCYDFLK